MQRDAQQRRHDRRCKRFRGGDVAYAGAVTAALDNGVLEVRIPKPEQPTPQRVQIVVGGGEPRTVEGETTAPGSEQ